MLAIVDMQRAYRLAWSCKYTLYIDIYIYSWPLFTESLAPNRQPLNILPSRRPLIRA